MSSDYSIKTGRNSAWSIPPYLRKSKPVEELIPSLYLLGISVGDIQATLDLLVGAGSPGLSPNVVTRLASMWTKELDVWNRPDLSDVQYVYIKEDGVYFNIRLGDDDRLCILVIIGATAYGRKVHPDVHDGNHESEQSWHKLLLDLKQRGLCIALKIAVGDGTLGFWSALRKIFPSTREQRCWAHKPANILNRLPRNLKPEAKADLHQNWMAETRAHALEAFEHFDKDYRAKYPRAVECLKKDIEALLGFYGFPADHWIHMLTTYPIESTFATVQLRHRRTKGTGSRTACLAMVFQLLQVASKRWRRVQGHKLLIKVIEGIKLVDEIEKDAA